MGIKLVWGGEKVLDSSDGCITKWIHLMLLNWLKLVRENYINVDLKTLGEKTSYLINGVTLSLDGGLGEVKRDPISFIS